MSQKNNTTMELVVGDARAQEDNTSIISFFASIMARITYEPPIIYQLGLIEIMKILQETKVNRDNNMLYFLNIFIDEVNNVKSQKEFINLIKDKKKMVSLSQVAKKINDRLYSLEKEIYRVEGIKPLTSLQKGGQKYMDINKLSEQFKKEFTNAANGDIKTVYIQTNHDENVYITAFKTTNTITVTFRGTASIKNALTDANALAYRACSNPAIKIKELGGMITMIDSTLNTLMYALLYLSKTFLKQGAANIYTFGHSLGGGLTTIFAYQYIGAHQVLNKDEQKLLSPNITCISNAAPRVLNKVAMEEFMSYVADGKIKYLRQWTDSDWVPAVPPQISGYYHPKATGITTTLKLAQTYNLNQPHMVNYNKSLKGIINAGTGKSVPSIIAHCFQTYINYWPVVKRFSLGADKDTKKAEVKHKQSGSTSKINIKFVSMGDDGLKSHVFEVAETPISKESKAEIDSGVVSYNWLIENVINELESRNKPLPSEPLLGKTIDVNQVKQVKEVLPELKKIEENFANALCNDYTKNKLSSVGGKKSRTKKNKKNKKSRTKKNKKSRTKKI